MKAHRQLTKNWSTSVPLAYQLNSSWINIIQISRARNDLVTGPEDSDDPLEDALVVDGHRDVGSAERLFHA